MPIKTILRKRRAKYAGELGLFPDHEKASEDLLKAKGDRDLSVTISSPRSLRQLRYIWAIAGILAENCDHLRDSDDAMDYLKLKCRHYRLIHDPLLERWIPVPMSLSSLDSQGLARFIDRAVWVICNEILPGLAEGPLRAELERIVGPNEQPKRPIERQRQRH